MNPNAIDHLVKGLQHFAVFHKLTNINALDNYGYRELMQIVELRQILPSIEKVPGRSGVDAVAPEQGYANIELKSTGIKKIPTVDRWPSAMFDMSKMTSQQKVYEFEGFGHGLFAPGQPIPICSYWIGKGHFTKLHPLFDKKIEAYKQLKESKNSMREEIQISLKEILDYINKEDIVFFKDGKVTHDY